MQTKRDPSSDAIWLFGIRQALGRAPLWLCTWAIMLLLSLILAAPWVAQMSAMTAHDYAPGSVLGSMDETFRFDQRASLEGLRGQVGASAAFLALVAMLVGIFSAGGWLQVFLERTSGHSVRRFLWGGAKYFWRFLRLWFLSILCISILTWICHGWPWRFALQLLLDVQEGELETLGSETAALWVEWTQDGLFGLGIALLLVWGDYTRTRMALHNSSSSVWAGLCTFFMLLLHPVRCLRPLLVIFLLEWGVITLVGKWSWSLNTNLGAESGAGSLLLLFAVGQAALLWQAISRAARYAAAVRVSRALVAPIARPDPWGSRVGGPGGPQYPIDVSDDYGVSI